ncbi:MAG: hypothetical protein JSS96_02225 [Bacteroidetes bacterium]|nr:hypothetical protein [Bacteroidota bacterium]
MKTKSEALLPKLIGTKLAKACTYDTGTYYDYVTSSGDTAWGILLEDKRTQGRVINIFSRYFMHYVYTKCPEYDTISCSITLQLNNRLELDIDPDLSVIPDFVLKNEGCHLLTIREAKDIAKEKYLILSDREPYAYIFYDHVKKQFTWHIQNAYYDTRSNNYRAQFVTIDANTGALISEQKL